jgi:hypothetical protein
MIDIWPMIDIWLMIDIWPMIDDICELMKGIFEKMIEL